VEGRFRGYLREEVRGNVPGRGLERGYGVSAEVFVVPPLRDIQLEGCGGAISWISQGGGSRECAMDGPGTGVRCFVPGEISTWKGLEGRIRGYLREGVRGNVPGRALERGYGVSCRERYPAGRAWRDEFVDIPERAFAVMCHGWAWNGGTVFRAGRDIHLEGPGGAISWISPGKAGTRRDGDGHARRCSQERPGQEGSGSMRKGIQDIVRGVRKGIMPPVGLQ